MVTADALTKLMDEIAETLHNVWWSIAIENGHTLGPRDRETKHHPHLIPWSAKSEQERTQDRYQAVRVMAKFRSEPGATADVIAKVIHDALGEFCYATRPGSLPDHLSQEASLNEERLRQAAAILPLLRCLVGLIRSRRQVAYAAN